MKIIKSDAAEFKKFFGELRRRGGVHSPELLSSVAKIVSDVEAHGDKALFKYTAKFDGYKLTAATVEVTPAEKKKALPRLSMTPQDVRFFKDGFNWVGLSGLCSPRLRAADFCRRAWPAQRER